MLHSRFASAFLIGSMLPLAACDEPTEGRIGEAAAPPGSFDTKTGWHVELSRATLALAPVYVYAPATGPVASPLTELFGVPKALAHGGHDPFSGRNVRAELLDAVVVDALDPSLTQGAEIAAEAGVVDSVTVVLGEHASPETSGHQAWVEGTATKDGTTVEFFGGLDLPDDPLVRRVENVSIAAELDAGGTILVGLRPGLWFSNAHFDRLDAVGPDGRFEIGPTSQVRNAWYLDLRRADAFRARWLPHNGDI
jgi:hypothetical protein